MSVWLTAENCDTLSHLTEKQTHAHHHHKFKYHTTVCVGLTVRPGRVNSDSESSASPPTTRGRCRDTEPPEGQMESNASSSPLEHSELSSGLVKKSREFNWLPTDEKKAGGRRGDEKHSRALGTTPLWAPNRTELTHHRKIQHLCLLS